MSRIFQALQKSTRGRAVDPEPSTNGSVDPGRGPAAIPASPARDHTEAAAVLLQNNLLTDSFGAQGEWEVRTTLVANRRAWRYRCRVFMHGKEVRKGFPAIDGDRTRQIRQAGTVTEDMLTAFAREAAEVHCGRCASVAEHLRLASMPARPRRWYAHLPTLALIFCGVVALVGAYWLWQGAESPGPEPPPDPPAAHQPEPITPDPPAHQPEPTTPVPRLPRHWTW
jgi:hypothetical protein